jgi:hypothetical protein
VPPWGTPEHTWERAQTTQTLGSNPMERAPLPKRKLTWTPNTKAQLSQSLTHRAFGDVSCYLCRVSLQSPLRGDTRESYPVEHLCNHRPVSMQKCILLSAAGRSLTILSSDLTSPIGQVSASFVCEGMLLVPVLRGVPVCKPCCIQRRSLALSLC